MDAVFDVIVATSRLGGGANFIVCSRRGAIQAFGHVAAATIDLEDAIFESWRGCLRSRWKGRSYLEREERKRERREWMEEWKGEGMERMNGGKEGRKEEI